MRTILWVIVLIILIWAGYWVWQNKELFVPANQEAAEMTEGEKLSAKVGEEFDITLASNPTTGYLWEAEYDGAYLELEGKEYTPMESPLVGSGGSDKFTFHPLKEGEAKITFKYQRSWEEQPIETKIYLVTIE